MWSIASGGVQNPWSFLRSGDGNSSQPLVNDLSSCRRLWCREGRLMLGTARLRYWAGLVLKVLAVWFAKVCGCVACGLGGNLGALVSKGALSFAPRFCVVWGDRRAVQCCGSRFQSRVSLPVASLEWSVSSFGSGS